MSEFNISDYRLSASGLEKLSCPRRWKFYYVEGRKDSAGAPAMLGSFAHEALEEFYALEPMARTKERLRTIAMERWQAFSDEYAKDINEGKPLTEQQVNEIKTQIWHGLENVFDMENPPDVDVHSVEMEVKASFEGVPYIGFVDRIDHVGPQLVLKDYKCGNLPRVKFMSSKLMQLMLYGWALDQMGIQTNRAELYYIKGKMIVGAQINQESHDAVKRHLEEAVTSIQGFIDEDEFPPVTSPLCGWCPYALDCPEGEEHIMNMRRFGRMRSDAPAYLELVERDRGKPGSDQSLVELFWEL